MERSAEVVLPRTGNRPPTAASTRPDAGARGILAPVRQLDLWLGVTLVVLTVASAIRYVQGHGLGDRAGLVLGGAALLLVLYAVGRWDRWAGDGWWPAAWCAVLVLTWFGLVLLAPSFAWCAVPLAFVALRVLPFGPAAAVVAGMVVAVAATWTAMRGTVDPTVLAGPACVALLVVVAYRALERDNRLRTALLTELRDAQGDLADAQHRAGALAERSRLSREIHDSVAQGLSSVNLLLVAADQELDVRPAVARNHLQQAARTARESLEEARRLVRNLAPGEAGLPGPPLADNLRDLTARSTQATGLAAAVHVHGTPVPLAEEVATALLRTARGALANVVEHAAADRVTVTLTYQGEAVSLDVRDDGRGFDPDARVRDSDSVRGRGLRGMRSRAEALGGQLVVESAPGEGTAVAVSLPRAARASAAP